VLLDTLPLPAARERWLWWRHGRRHGLHGQRQRRRKLDHRRPIRAGFPRLNHRGDVRHLPPASVVHDAQQRRLCAADGWNCIDFVPKQRG
ncbi:unnamed protein product, partial [Ectocarpus sp. 12 AP-2014]